MNEKRQSLEFERTPDIKKYTCSGNDEKKANIYRNNLKLALTHGVNEFKKTAVKKLINNKIYKIHRRVNLYLDITSNCPNDCGFCIAKTNTERKGNIKLKDIEKNINFLLKNNIKFTCQITGGEPEKHNRLKEIFKILPNTKTVINTNYPSEISFNADHVNISCHHYNNNIDNKIFKHNRDKEDLKKRISINPEKVRLQCNIIGSYIDTYGEIMQYIAYGYHYLNVTNFSFSYLTALPKNNIYKQSIIDYVNKHKAITFKDTIKKFKTTTHWEFKKYRGGVACYYEIWHYKAYERNITVVLKYSNNNVLHELDNKDEYIPDLIMHPSGVLTGSWNNKVKILNY